MKFESSLFPLKSMPRGVAFSFFFVLCFHSGKAETCRLPLEITESDCCPGWAYLRLTVNEDTEAHLFKETNERERERKKD